MMVTAVLLFVFLNFKINLQEALWTGILIKRSSFNLAFGQGIPTLKKLELGSEKQLKNNLKFLRQFYQLFFTSLDSTNSKKSRLKT